MHKYSTRDFDRDFPDDNACLAWLFETRWPEGVNCQICGKVTHHYRIAGRPCYSCQFCGSQVYPMAGTIFADSKLPLRLWFKAFGYMAVTRCGVSARQLGRDLGLRPNTALRMWKQIRSILSEDEGQLSGEVEVDETYIGGKDKNRHANKRGGVRGRGATGKAIVMGMVERNGRVRAIVVPDVQAATLLPKIRRTVLRDAILYTDDLLSYKRVGQDGYDHRTVAHSEGVYVTGGDIHTNTIEGFWSQLKRSINGTYHHVTAGHLQGYLDEYAFRYSHRNDEQPMFWTMLGQVAKRAS